MERSQTPQNTAVADLVLPLAINNRYPSLPPLVPILATNYSHDCNPSKHYIFTFPATNWHNALIDKPTNKKHDKIKNSSNNVCCQPSPSVTLVTTRLSVRLHILSSEYILQSVHYPMSQSIKSTQTVCLQSYVWPYEASKFSTKQVLAVTNDTHGKPYKFGEFSTKTTIAL